MTTLLEAVRAVADNLGGWGLLTVTESPDVSDPDARRTLISTDLVDEDRDPTAFNDLTLYAVGGALDGEQVAVRRDMYDGTSGRLYSSGLWSAIPQVGQEVEYHARLPRRRHFGEPGVREVVNQAIDRMAAVTETAMTGNGTASYPAPAWLTTGRQLVGVASGDPPRPDGRSVALVSDTAVPSGPQLRVGYAYGTGEPFVLLARRPASSWIKVAGSGTYADSTVGLVDDADEAQPSVLAIATVATWLAYRALSLRAPDFTLGPWSQQALIWEVKAAHYLQWVDGRPTPLLTPTAAGGAWAKGWTP